MSNHHQPHHPHHLNHHHERTTEAPGASNYAGRLLSRMLSDRKKPDKPTGISLHDVVHVDGKGAVGSKR